MIRLGLTSATLGCAVTPAEVKQARELCDASQPWCWESVSQAVLESSSGSHEGLDEACSWADGSDDTSPRLTQVDDDVVVCGQFSRSSAVVTVSVRNTNSEEVFEVLGVSEGSLRIDFSSASPYRVPADRSAPIVTTAGTGVARATIGDLESFQMSIDSFVEAPTVRSRFAVQLHSNMSLVDRVRVQNASAGDGDLDLSATADPFVQNDP
jgi:hypothetical protein